MSKTFRAVALAGVLSAAALAVPQAAQAAPTQGCQDWDYPTSRSYQIRCFIHNMDHARAAVRCLDRFGNVVTERYGTTVTVGDSVATCPWGTVAAWGYVDYSV
ncbi:hypothetical protein [Longispora albida]|uniref:hypothetical protein n=1 Tax=Longispora albida TaxID=203523 RepID=UPI000366E3F2|nr:hypothetical protein [Longispora albida]